MSLGINIPPPASAPDLIFIFVYYAPRSFDLESATLFEVFLYFSGTSDNYPSIMAGGSLFAFDIEDLDGLDFLSGELFWDTVCDLLIDGDFEVEDPLLLDLLLPLPCLLSVLLFLYLVPYSNPTRPVLLDIKILT